LGLTPRAKYRQDLAEAREMLTQGILIGVILGFLGGCGLTLMWVASKSKLAPKIPTLVSGVVHESEDGVIEYVRVTVKERSHES
jgi:hypothetical protein